MAKKKKRKTKEKQTASYSVELKGIILILIAIIGCCPFGIAADVIKGFSAFLTGAWYVVPLIGLGVCGGYMMVKRDKPDFFTSNLIGLYILFLGILILSHTEYIKQLDTSGASFDVLKETINNVMGFVSNNQTIQGGGIIGGIFAVLGVKLLTLEGTEVVCIALIICGTIMFTGVSIYDAVNAIKAKLAKAKEERRGRIKR